MSKAVYTYELPGPKRQFSTDWYDTIEEPVRNIVKMLRENGINTQCSCGHDMYIQCEFYPGYDTQHLHIILCNYFHKYHQEPNFRIESLIEMKNSNLHCGLNIYFPKDWRFIDKQGYPRLKHKYKKINL